MSDWHSILHVGFLNVLIFAVGGELTVPELSPSSRWLLLGIVIVNILACHLLTSFFSHFRVFFKDRVKGSPIERLSNIFRVEATANAHLPSRFLLFRVGRVLPEVSIGDLTQLPLA